MDGLTSTGSKLNGFKTLPLLVFTLGHNVYAKSSIKINEMISH